MRRNGYTILLALFISSCLLILAVSLTKVVGNLAKDAGLMKRSSVDVHNAMSGIRIVSEYMTQTANTKVPDKIKNTGFYSVSVKLLENSTRYMSGYSFLWKGVNVLLVSTSEDAEVEAVVFVPLEPEYGD